MKEHQRFYALDGLRGLAAVAIMLGHYTHFFLPHWVKNSSGAVDLFFVLSGFVIVHSYGQKIMNGMKLSEFVLIRFIRLAPLNVMGILIALATFALMHPAMAKHYSITAPAFFKAIFLGIGFIPYENSYGWPYGNYAEIGGVFPLNMPAWSSSFGLLAGIACFFYIAIAKKLPSLRFCLTCFGIFAVTILLSQNINPGWSSGQFLLGLIRVMGDFFVGALIFKMSMTSSLLKSVIACASFISVFCLFVVGNTAAVIVNILVLIPLLIWSMRTVSLHGNIKQLCKGLGLISFPLYIIHIPIITLLLHQKTFIELFRPDIRLCIVILVASITAIILSYLDIKVRHFIIHVCVQRGLLKTPSGA
jgi:peptidoglycan/LPS O-acetylase OafA/YrhL